MSVLIYRDFSSSFSTFLRSSFSFFQFILTFHCLFEYTISVFPSSPVILHSFYLSYQLILIYDILNWTKSNINSFSTVLIIQINRHVPIHEFSYNLIVILQQLYQPFEQIQDCDSSLKRIRRKNKKQKINKKYYDKKILNQRNISLIKERRNPLYSIKF